MRVRTGYFVVFDELQVTHDRNIISQTLKKKFLTHRSDFPSFGVPPDMANFFCN